MQESLSERGTGSTVLTRGLTDPFAIPVLDTVTHRHTDRCREAEEVLEAVPGLTYRQLDYWTSRGYIKPNSAHPGHGVYRCWDIDEVRVLKCGFALITYGFMPAAGIELARSPSCRDIVDVLERVA